MPTLIKLTFPAGRYHATPWGRNVNEGVAEWPPSPWRLLRAIVAVWKRTCPNLPEVQVQRILAALIAPPRFRLPSHRVAHTRHYMPTNSKSPKDLKGGGTTLVFDTFVSVARQEQLYIGWPDAILSMEDRGALARILSNLSSLGRAESWTTAELSNEDVELDIFPADRAESNPIPVICPDPASAFSDDYYPTHDAKKLANGKINPADYLFDCPRWHLCLDTETIHAERWPMVPGAKWVNYRRPQEARIARHRTPISHSSLPTMARFLLDAPVLPLVKNTVQVAESFRKAAMSQFGKCCCGRDEAARFLRSDTAKYASPNFSGKSREGVILEPQQHAYFLPLPDKIDPRRVREVIVYAPSGLEQLEITALKRLRDIKSDELSCRTQLIGLGDASSVERLGSPSTIWTSLTPFIAHRHAKSRGRNRDIPQDPSDPRGSFLAVAVREICQKRGLPLVDAAPLTAANNQLQFYEFRRARRKTGNDAYTRAAGYLRLQFSEPVYGPLCLGYNSHFGMGLFTAEGLL
jgi:CRISPR-associated protein Csb2